MPILQNISIAFLLFLTVLWEPAGAQEPLLVRQPGESLQSFALTIIPKGMKLAHPVVTGDVGPFKKSVVILFQPEKYREFTGWVLAPEDNGYRKYALPFVQLPVSTEVKAVFFTNADQDKNPELFILCKHISGAGRYPGNITPFCNTYVFDWDGNGFTYLEDVSASLDSCTAAGVRRKLANIGR
jgi:hypothetical protein